MEKAKIYFTREITPEAVIKMYKQLGKELPGKVAVKVHSGGMTDDQNILWSHVAEQDAFCEAMAEPLEALWSISREMWPLST